MEIFCTAFNWWPMFSGRKLFFCSGQNAPWKYNTPKQRTVYFATVLQMWYWHLLTMLGATAYGYHSVKSTLSHTFYYCLNTCFNILILSISVRCELDWQARTIQKLWKHWFSPRRALSPSPTPPKQKAWKRKKTIPKRSHCLGEKTGKGMKHSLIHTVKR